MTIPPDTSLAQIPWQELSEPLQQACWEFIHTWMNTADLDLLREISGLNAMTLAELLAFQEHHKKKDTAHRRYHLIPFMRIDPEATEPVAYEEALAEKEQQELMSPENIYRIEEEQKSCASSSK